MMKMKKALMGTMLAGAVVVGAGWGAGTFSDFTSSASVNDNKIEAGTLSLEATGQAFNATNVAPGFEESRTFEVKNTGSLDAKNIRATVTVSLKDKNDNPITNLGAYNNFQFVLDGNTVTLAQLKPAIENYLAAQDLTLGDGEKLELPVTVKLLRAADDTYQGLKVNVGVTVSAKAYQ